ncbi:MAG: hypothetical protein ACE5IR_27430, partial [bacterium]
MHSYPYDKRVKKRDKYKTLSCENQAKSFSKARTDLSLDSVIFSHEIKMNLSSFYRYFIAYIITARLLQKGANFSSINLIDATGLL